MSVLFVVHYVIRGQRDKKESEETFALRRIWSVMVYWNGPIMMLYVK